MQILLLTFSLIMTEERSKRRELLPFIFIVKCFKTPLLIRLSFTIQEIISDDDDDEFNIPLSSSVKKTKTTQ